MATGFLILSLYGLCIFLIVGLLVIGGALYFLGRREERRASESEARLHDPSSEID